MVCKLVELKIASTIYSFYIISCKGVGHQVTGLYHHGTYFYWETLFLINMYSENLAYLNTILSLINICFKIF